MDSYGSFGGEEPRYGTEHEEDWLVGGGRMGELIRSMDWSRTPLGPLAGWPYSLRTTVNLCLSSNFPINILWGRESNQIYNDGYRIIVGEKHPAGMGMSYGECWESAWPEIGAPFEEAWSGKTSFIENRRMFLTRNGYLEETFFTFSLSPIRDERGVIAGLFHPVTETTGSMLSERRTRALRELGASQGEARLLASAFAHCAAIFAAHAFDLPFALLYELDAAGTEAHLRGHSGIDAGLRASPQILSHSQARSRWPFAQILSAAGVVEIDGLQDRFQPFPCGPYPEGVRLAFARKLQVAGKDTPIGILIAGVSPRLPLNQEYRDHLDQIAAATATVLGNALAYQRERERAEALAELDRSKTLFFSDVSHEFRTPLTLLLGPIERLLEQTGLSETQTEQLEIAHRNGLRLLKLVNTLLDFSRVEGGRVQASFEPVELGDYTAEIASNFRSACERAGIELRITTSPLPQPVYVDREMWEKIVLNLVSNALKFTLEGHIAISVNALPEQVECVVTDTGVGIPREELPSIFKRFYRVRSTRGRSHEGSGIGLALVRELVRLHGGTIEVQSDVGRGTTFRILLRYGRDHLPLDQVASGHALASTAIGAQAYVAEALRWNLPAVTSNSRVGAPAPSGTGAEESKQRHLPAVRARVLVVDDNADMRDHLQRLLVDEYDVLSAIDGEAALREMQTYLPDLVIADVMMPGLDGFSLLAALRADPVLQATPVILLSARAGEESRIEGLQAGADDYLVKPFAARELLARVANSLQLARVRQEAAAVVRLNEERFRALSNASADVIYRMSPDWTEMRRLDGRGRLVDTPAPSRNWVDEYIDVADRPLVLETIGNAIRTKGIFELEHRVRLTDGSLGWTLSRAVPLLGPDGEISEWVGSATDITALRQNEELRSALAERDALLKEIHHRVKNNLQVITSLLEMQSRQTSDPETTARFDEACNRVGSIAAIHEMLYQAGSFSGVNLCSYAQRLVPYLVAFYGEEQRIQVLLQGDDIQIELEKAVPCGLLLNELVSNVCKHAFPDGRAGTLTVSFAQGERTFRLSVEDTGVGIPADFNVYTSPTLGLQLVRSLAEQLKGEITFRFGPGCRTDVDIPR